MKMKIKLVLTFFSGKSSTRVWTVRSILVYSWLFPARYSLLHLASLHKFCEISNSFGFACKPYLFRIAISHVLFLSLPLDATTNLSLGSITKAACLSTRSNEDSECAIRATAFCDSLAQLLFTNNYVTANCHY